jgi:hypothetical protein
MQNVVPAQALSRRSRRWLYAAAGVALVAALLLVIGVLLRFVPLVVPSNPSYPIYVTIYNLLLAGGGALLLVAGAVAVRALTWKQDNPLALSTGQALAEFVDERFIFIRNVSKRAIGYVDAVLVGPPGVLVFRICDHRGVFYNEGNKWMIQQDQGRWKPLSWSPTDEVIADIRKIREYLMRHQIASPQVFGVVVFLGEPPATVVTIQNPTVPVAHLDELHDRLLGNYFALMDRHDAATVTRIAELLYL